MEQIKINPQEIIMRLAKLQSDIDYIKEKLSLDEEMKIWEQASAEDNAEFFEKNDL